MKTQAPLERCAGKRTGIGRNATSNDYPFIGTVGLEVGQEVPNGTNDVQIFISFAGRKAKNPLIGQ
jgi:hypothetical protein